MVKYDYKYVYFDAKYSILISQKSSCIYLHIILLLRFNSHRIQLIIGDVNWITVKLQIEKYIIINLPSSLNTKIQVKAEYYYEGILAIFNSKTF